MERMNILLDLDSTVISSLRPWDPQPSGLTGYNMDDEYIVYERPQLQEFLDYLFANFTVAVWTAASKDYARFIVEQILLQGKPNRKLSFMLFSFHGGLSQKVSDCPKDLTLVWNTFDGFTPQNTIIIDDFEDVFSPQMSNSYPIPPFEADEKGAKDDKELIKLMNKLKLVKPGEVPNDPLITEITLQKAFKKMGVE